ncbi:cyclin-dependent protein kinase inhibitor SMR6-like [Prosopis cineraria]|uniref:cyclin-dependent protein kinase inhibitor SMR6-like n=1 Tax=Prosopis cineraria TaxID=364024 RepID=UPI00240FE2A7|nr:cyclin-dependent protein kinase inhibitor SMR6-like [Prosopis cineraria]XP_054810823.1 cyclin-dependent protein kinase inhibitor SMR6-like [Prosopis cineraria]
MGFSEKAQVVEGGGFESSSSSDTATNKKWVIAGIALRAPLKPIYTAEKARDGEELETDQECLTTPTGEESRIPPPSTCPPAPRKPKPPSSFKCKYRRGVNKFFAPPDLDTVFIRHVEKAS